MTKDDVTVFQVPDHLLGGRDRMPPVPALANPIAVGSTIDVDVTAILTATDDAHAKPSLSCSIIHSHHVRHATTAWRISLTATLCL